MWVECVGMWESSEKSRWDTESPEMYRCASLRSCVWDALQVVADVDWSAFSEEMG